MSLRDLLVDAVGQLDDVETTLTLDCAITRSRAERELQARCGQTLFEICARLITRHGSASSRQAISQHLDVLDAAGPARTRREGRNKCHDLDTTPLQEITARWPQTDGRRPE